MTAEKKQQRQDNQSLGNEISKLKHLENWSFQCQIKFTISCKKQLKTLFKTKTTKNFSILDELQ